VPFRPLLERRRRIVVVIDGSPESEVALRFAAGRAVHVDGGSLVLFHAIPPAQFGHWMAVEDKMKEESVEQAEALMRDVAGKVYDYCGHHAEIIITHGKPKDELIAFMDKEEDIFALFLGASTAEDPGPLVDYFSGTAVGSMKCIVVIVPGGLSDEQIDAMA